MATLAGQRASFTWWLNRYNSTDDEDIKEKLAASMARYILAAPTNGFTVEQVTQGQSYPADRVAKYLNGPLPDSVSEITEEKALQSLASVVDVSDVLRDGNGKGTLYAYGYRCAPDRLKIGITEGDTIQRVAAQISTGTPDKPVLLFEFKTDTCRAVERAIHGILDARGKKILGGGAEWFRTDRTEVLEICRFIQSSSNPSN